MACAHEATCFVVRGKSDVSVRFGGGDTVTHSYRRYESAPHSRIFRGSNCVSLLPSVGTSATMVLHTLRRGVSSSDWTLSPPGDCSKSGTNSDDSVGGVSRTPHSAIPSDVRVLQRAGENRAMERENAMIHCPLLPKAMARDVHIHKKLYHYPARIVHEWKTTHHKWRFFARVITFLRYASQLFVRAATRQSFAAAPWSGSSGNGSLRRLCSAISALFMDMAGDHPVRP